MSWLDEAKKLPPGHKARYVHCESTSNSSAIISFDGKKYAMSCFKCGENLYEYAGEMDFKSRMELRKINEKARRALQTRTVRLPKDFTLDIPKEGRLWLLKASITPHSARQHGIGWTPEHQRVVIPVYAQTTSPAKLIFYQARAVLPGQQPKYLNPIVDKSTVLYSCSPSSAPLKNDVCVVTEDILSAIRVGKFIQTYSLLGTKVLPGHINTLTEYKHVITWLDPDEAGIIGARKVRKAVGILTNTSNIVTDVDPKNLSDKKIQEVLECHIKTELSK